MSGILPKDALLLAPLAGYTDLPFREVAKSFGADITVSEMISAHALAYKNKKTLKMVEKSPIEDPFALQIAGNDLVVLKRAIEYTNTLSGISILDLNCGCPAPKVSGHGSGSSLLKDLNLMVKILKLMREVSNCPYISVKVRLGFDRKIPQEIAEALNDAPIDYVVVHGRTKSDGYKKEKIDYQSIAEMKQILKTPLIANGEINSAQSAKEVMQQTGANGVMIGRAAISSPWIFKQIKENWQEVPLSLQEEITLRHYDKMIEFYGDYGVIIFRKNLHGYSKGLRGASEFRTLVNSITDPLDMRSKIVAFFKSQEE